MSQTLEHDWWPRPVPRNVVIGEGSWIYSSYAFLHYRSEKPCGVRIGHDTGVYVGTMFQLDRGGEVSIGNYGAIAGPIIATSGRISIGDYALISYEVVIADSPFAGPPGGMEVLRRRADGDRAGEEISISDNVWIGAKAVVLGGAKIGEGSVIGAGAVVDFEVPSYSIVAGSPARIVGTVKRGPAA